jgi:hypothetical protein
MAHIAFLAARCGCENSLLNCELASQEKGLLFTTGVRDALPGMVQGGDTVAS